MQMKVNMEHYIPIGLRPILWKRFQIVESVNCTPGCHVTI